MFEGYEYPIECVKIYDIPAIEIAKAIIEKDPSSHIHVPMLADRAAIYPK